MTKQKKALFVPLKTFDKYSTDEKINFIEKMKEHRLMRHQSNAWGYGANYLSQMYSKMMPERIEKELREKEEKAKQEEIKKIAEKLPVIEQKEIVKLPVVEKADMADKHVVRTFESKEEKRLKKTQKERATIEVKDVDQETALSLLSELNNHFANDFTESVVKKSGSGFSISFKATQEELVEEVKKRA